MRQFIELAGRTYAITGAGSGIGRVIALKCAEYGARLLLLDKNRDGLAKTSELINQPSCIMETIDLTKFEEIESAIQEAVSQLGSFNGLCHCAGIEYTLPIQSMTPQHYLDLFAINTIAGFELGRVIAKKKYRKETEMSFVYIASIMGVVGRPGLTGYSASKGAIISGVRSMALELASKNIRVNSVSPGTIMTEMIRKMLDNLEPEQREKRLGDFPLGIGKPEDVADLVVFLLSERSRWITGSNIIIDGGYTAK